MEITFLGAVGSIGGNKFLVADGVDRESRILLDFGMQFGDPKSYAEAGGLAGSMGAFYDEFLQVRSKARLRDLMRLGILPAIDGLYREDWLVTPERRKAIAKRFGDIPFDDYWESDVESYQTYKQRSGRPFVDGVLLTHAHADHFQHLAYVDPEIPVYCTAVTKSIVQSAGEVSTNGDVEDAFVAKVRALKENGPKSAYQGLWKYDKAQRVQRPFHVVEPYTWFSVGAFRAQAIPIDHSVPGACFFLIEGQDGKRVLYTGDFRFHGVYEAASSEAKRRLLGLRPDALLCEGTRIDSDHQDSEADVRRQMKETFKGTKGLVLAEWGWKDASRFETMQQAAEAAGRTLLVDPRLAYMLHRLSHVDPAFRPIEAYGNVHVYVRRKDNLLYSPEDYAKHEMGYKSEWSKDDKQAVLRYLTGEDGIEAPSCITHLAHGVRADQVRKDPSKYVVQSSFFQMNELFDLDPPKGSFYARASCEPFNEEMEIDRLKLLNWLGRWDIDSNLEAHGSGHHTSGHASGKELADFWDIVQPKTLFPIHTMHPGRYAEWWPQGDVQAPKHGETITV